MSKFRHAYSEWKSLTTIQGVPRSQAIHVIRAVNVNKMPIQIDRARAEDCGAILSIGSRLEK